MQSEITCEYGLSAASVLKYIIELTPSAEVFSWFSMWTKFHLVNMPEDSRHCRIGRWGVGEQIERQTLFCVHQVQITY